MNTSFRTLESLKSRDIRTEPQPKFISSHKQSLVIEKVHAFFIITILIEHEAEIWPKPKNKMRTI